VHTIHENVARAVALLTQWRHCMHCMASRWCRHLPGSAPCGTTSTSAACRRRQGLSRCCFVLRVLLLAAGAAPVQHSMSSSVLSPEQRMSW
jgi:hypothetical protein